MGQFNPYQSLVNALGKGLPILLIGGLAIGGAQRHLGLSSNVPYLIMGLATAYMLYTGLRVKLHGDSMQFNAGVLGRVTLSYFGLGLIGGTTAILVMIGVSAVLPIEFADILLGQKALDDGSAWTQILAKAIILALLIVLTLVPIGLYGSGMAGLVDANFQRTNSAGEPREPIGARSSEYGWIFRQMAVGVGPFQATLIGVSLWQDHVLAKQLSAFPNSVPNSFGADDMRRLFIEIATANTAPPAYIVGTILIGIASMLTSMMLGMILAEAYLRAGKPLGPVEEAFE